MEYASRSLRRRRDTDKWEVALTHKDPYTGESITTYHTITAKTEAQARKERDRLIRDLEKRGSAIASGTTVGEYLDEFIDWKADTKSVEESTIYHYRRDARVVKRYIGSMQLRNLTRQDTAKMIASMSADGLAPRSIAKPYRLLRQAMRHAVQDDVLAKSPCEGVKPPKIERKQLNTLSKSERLRMLGIVTKPLRTPIKLAIHIALSTGMRRGEVCGLRWSDFDPEGQTLSVNRAIGISEHGWYVKEPKTKASRRTLPVTPNLLAILSALREETRRATAEVYAEMGDPYILGTQEPESKPYLPDRLSKDYHVFCEAHGFNLGFHDLRHTFATMLISEGVDIVTVASLLGHTNVAETLNTYGEIDPEAKKAARKAIQNTLSTQPACQEEALGSAQAPAPIPGQMALCLGQPAEPGEKLVPITLMLSAAQLESLKEQVLAALAQ